MTEKLFSQKRFNDACNRVVRYTLKIRVEDDKAIYLVPDQVDWVEYKNLMDKLDQANIDLRVEIDMLPEGLRAAALDDAEILTHVAIGWMIREARVGGVELAGFSPYQDWLATFLQGIVSTERKIGAKEALLEAADHALRLAEA